VYDGTVIRRTVGVLALAALALAGGRAVANDSEAVLAGGVLTLKKSDGITMESEDLSIKPREVKVSYSFRNTTAADISTRVAFPMAPYEPYGDDDDDRPKDAWGALGDFSVRVDGKPVEFESTVKVEEKSITATTRGRDGRVERHPITQKVVSVTHHWPQVFPAGKVVSVEHVFHPSGSFIYAFTEKYSAAEIERQLTHDYCVGPVLLRAMKRGDGGNVEQVHYILKTGANWSGPIGHFRLRIQKHDATDKVSLCLDGFRKVDDRTFVLEKTDYVPTQDLQIAFITIFPPFTH
jgi:hypothetical protein